MDKNKYSRDEFKYLAMLCERSKKYELMVEYCISFCKLSTSLNDEEKKILEAAFKNLYSIKIASWNKMQKIIKKEESGYNEKKKNLLINCDINVKKELFDLFKNINETCDYLILREVNNESVVFYYKLKADYSRYSIPLLSINDIEEKKIIKLTERLYKETYELSERFLPITSQLRLEIVINTSVYYYNNIKNAEFAFIIGRLMMRECIKIKGNLDPKRDIGHLKLIEILQNNIKNWESKSKVDFVFY